MQRRLGMQKLEDRELKAGEVFVSVVDGDLMITGDDASNSIEVHQLHDGRWLVEGRVSAGELTKINGVSWSQFGQEVSRRIVGGVTDDVRIDLGAGGDQLHMSNAGFWGPSQMQVPDDLVIEMGEDNVNDLNDTVHVQGVRTGDDLTIYTGNGDDTIELRNVVVGTGGNNDLTIDTGDDDPWDEDRVEVHNIAVRDDFRIYFGSLSRDQFRKSGTFDVDDLFAVYQL